RRCRCWHFVPIVCHHKASLPKVATWPAPMNLLGGAAVLSTRWPLRAMASQGDGLSGRWLVLVRWNDAFGEQETAVEAAFAGRDHGKSALGLVVEGMTLDADHRPRAAFGTVDLGLDLLLNRRHFVRAADDLHPDRGIIDEGIERQQREHGADGAGRTDIV